MKFSKKQIDKLKAYLNKDGKNIKPANERAGNTMWLYQSVINITSKNIDRSMRYILIA